MLEKGQNPIVNEITIDKLVYGGEGLGRLHGRVVLVRYVLPGETVRVETRSQSKSLLRARLLEVLEPAPERTEPRCDYFGRCGGCDYQQAGDEAQLRWKCEILTEVLRRVGKFAPPAEIAVVSSPPLEYRNRVQLHIERERLGFRVAGARTLQPVLHCPVAAPLLNQGLASLRKMAHQPRFPRFLRSLELFTNGTEVQVNALDTGSRRLARGFFEWCAASIPGASHPVIDYKAAGETFRVGRRSFFQVNRFLVDRLVETVLEADEGETALDLYAGVGLLSLPLARKFSSVTAVESGRGAVEDLNYNARQAGLGVRVAPSTAELYLEQLGIPPDQVVADPPRAGLGKAVVRHLSRLRPPKLTIVSCDPSTLARDLAGLLGSGYEIESMTLLDLFPQTRHIETVTRLRCAPA